MISSVLRSKLLMPLLVIGVAFFGLFLHKRSKDGYGHNNLKSTSGVSPSITDYQASLYADDLFVAMRRTGTDEDAIKKVVNACNPEDWRLVHNAFGEKRYGITGDFVLGTPMNLKHWLRNELRSRRDAKLISRIKDLYKASGVLY